ncbi:mechanosensitive ion channel protein MscS [Corallococcus llansteffanensis]|uniref:Mechanosensitive ion channel protein MscS n=1 Tax=Corallococcus llansteffanensis TaxID=2316731 RepID=A0A3A8QR09_9BACT|nr:mechanosensitive ion channel protein MscS [Corallococcus llansteffanensis]
MGACISARRAPVNRRLDPRARGRSDSRNVLNFLEGHLPLVAGAILTVLLLGIHGTTRDPDLRDDLKRAVRMLVAFLALRLIARFLPEASTPEGLRKALGVGWMLTFAYGVIRAAVAFALKLVRMRSPVTTPKILRDVIDFTLYALATVPILQSQLNLDLAGLVATSAVLTVVIGLALQETLGNLFAGLSLQLDRPFEVGDFIRIGEHTGRVVHIGWRSIRVANFRRELITLPNSMVAKEHVKNFTQHREPVGIEVQVGVSLDAPPNQVKQALLDVAREIPQILVQPPPLARTVSFGESNVQYMVRVFLNDFALSDSVREELHTRLWYRLRREGLELPHAQRTVHLRREGGAKRRELADNTVRDLLRQVDLFAPLGPEELERLHREVVVRRFGQGERIIQEGDEGGTFYVVAAGEVSVRAGTIQAEITRLGPGHYIGEMSLLTGERRAATVVALQDAVLLELDRPTFARLFSDYPGLARQLSALLAQRRTQLRAVAQASGGGPDHTPEAGRILGRLRQLFGLTHE